MDEENAKIMVQDLAGQKFEGKIELTRYPQPLREGLIVRLRSIKLDLEKNIFD